MPAVPAPVAAQEDVQVQDDVAREEDFEDCREEEKASNLDKRGFWLAREQDSEFEDCREEEDEGFRLTLDEPLPLDSL